MEHSKELRNRSNYFHNISNFSKLQKRKILNGKNYDNLIKYCEKDELKSNNAQHTKINSRWIGVFFCFKNRQFVRKIRVELLPPCSSLMMPAGPISCSRHVYSLAPHANLCSGREGAARSLNKCECQAPW